MKVFPSKLLDYNYSDFLALEGCERLCKSKVQDYKDVHFVKALVVSESFDLLFITYKLPKPTGHKRSNTVLSQKTTTSTSTTMLEIS